MRRSLFYRWLAKVSLPPLGRRRADCWIWIGARNKDGYGMLYDGRNGRRGVQYAHVLACDFYNGISLDYRGVRRHTCHRRECVNPHHLVTGTQAQNLADMLQRKGINWSMFWRTGVIAKRDENGKATNV